MVVLYSSASSHKHVNKILFRTFTLYIPNGAFVNQLDMHVLYYKRYMFIRWVYVWHIQLTRR